MNVNDSHVFSIKYNRRKLKVVLFSREIFTFSNFRLQQFEAVPKFIPKGLNFPSALQIRFPTPFVKQVASNLHIMPPVE